MEDLPINNPSPNIYTIILKFIVYIIAYIIIPICIFNWVVIPVMSYPAWKQITSKLMLILVDLLFIFIIYKLYKSIISIILGRLRLNLRSEWINYLTFKEWKIRYYKQISLYLEVSNQFSTFFFKIIDHISNIFKYGLYTSTIFLIIFIYFVGCSIIWADYHERIFGFNVWESELLINYANSFNLELFNLVAFLIFSILFTAFILCMLIFLFLFIEISIIKCVFPVENNRVDTSDVPISFIKDAINKLESFNFSDSCLHKQEMKDQTTQLISYALDFYIKVDNGNSDPYYTSFCYILWSGHLSKAAQNDVLFRTNGLYKKIDDVCAKINNMNSREDREIIVQELTMYLKFIEDRDLSKIEGVPYKMKKSSLITVLIKGAALIQKMM